MSYLGLRKHLIMATALTAAFFAVAGNAKAAPHHERKHSASRFVPDASGNVVGHRPKGCPHAYCGCEASLYLFGVIKRDLNLAWNWARKFPRANPAPRMAAVRRHHVMVLIRHIKGKRWLVHDGNSGGHLTREHVRSIAGYVIVNPNSVTASAN